MNETHHGLIVDQFTRQATPFSTAATITDENALRMIVAAGPPSADDAMWTWRAAAASWLPRSPRMSATPPAST